MADRRDDGPGKLQGRGPERLGGGCRNVILEEAVEVQNVGLEQLVERAHRQVAGG
jgi:hypothetical protein